MFHERVELAWAPSVADELPPPCWRPTRPWRCRCTAARRRPCWCRCSTMPASSARHSPAAARPPAPRGRDLVPGRAARRRRGARRDSAARGDEEVGPPTPCTWSALCRRRRPSSRTMRSTRSWGDRGRLPGSRSTPRSTRCSSCRWRSCAPATASGGWSGADPVPTPTYEAVAATSSGGRPPESSASCSAAFDDPLDRAHEVVAGLDDRERDVPALGRAARDRLPRAAPARTRRRAPAYRPASRTASAGRRGGRPARGRAAARRPSHPPARPSACRSGRGRRRTARPRPRRSRPRAPPPGPRTT